MCVIYFSFQPDSARPLLVAANRDEFHARGSDVAAFWSDHPEVLAGRDQTAGGTWVGVTRTGRFAAVTNFGEPPPDPMPPASRGDLTREFLIGSMSPRDWAQEVKRTGENYRGFNLLIGDQNSLYYVSNRKPGVHELAPGVYAVANQLLDSDSPRILRGKAAFAKLIDADEERLFELLADRSVPPDCELPDRGNGIEHERRVAPCFILGEEYGTRASTVIALGREELLFVEQNFGPNGVVGERNDYRLRVEGYPAACAEAG